MSKTQEYYWQELLHDSYKKYKIDLLEAEYREGVSFLSDEDIDLNTPVYFDKEPQASERSRGWKLGAKWARDRILNNKH